jgi:uncharacterized cupredoxin-like copper-binding protein
MNRVLIASAFVALLAVAAPAAGWAAPTTVNVELVDPTTGAGVSGMNLQSDHPTVAAGPVRFHVVNKSRSVVHEMIVVAVTNPDEALPYDANAGRVIEKKIRHLGEVSDLKPGKSGNLQLTLKPGSYMLICNQPGHFEAGMKTSLTVTP